MNKPEIFMDIAQQVGQLGTCDRKHVGALIIRDGRCISWGYNGAPPGLPHCADNEHGWIGKTVIEEEDNRAEFRGILIDPVEKHGCRNATHAEANAIAFAARQGISTDKGELFVTVAPCDACSRLIIAAGISLVYYRERYRDISGLELLYAAEVATIHL